MKETAEKGFLSKYGISFSASSTNRDHKIKSLYITLKSSQWGSLFLGKVRSICDDFDRGPRKFFRGTAGFLSKWHPIELSPVDYNADPTQLLGNPYRIPKLRYYSPSWNHFKVGISLIPNTFYFLKNRAVHNLNSQNTFSSKKLFKSKIASKNMVELGLLYHQKLHQKIILDISAVLIYSAAQIFFKHENKTIKQSLPETKGLKLSSMVSYRNLILSLAYVSNFNTDAYKFLYSTASSSHFQRYMLINRKPGHSFSFGVEYPFLNNILQFGIVYETHRLGSIINNKLRGSPVDLGKSQQINYSIVLSKKILSGLRTFIEFNQKNLITPKSYLKFISLYDNNSLSISKNISEQKIALGFSLKF